MSEEQIFRAVVLVSLLGVLPIGIYYRVKSQATRERLDRRQEGMFILTTLRPVAAACWVGMIAWLIDPRSMAWSAVSVPVAFRWAGVAVLFSGAALLIWTFRSLGPNLTDTVVTRQKHTLVMRGPYRWIRHPLYLSTALLVVAMSLVAANWFLAATGAMVCGLLVIRTRTEEGNLIVRFGDDYRQYMQRTGGFLPRVRANRHDA
jgi:protein-S-isoprenylcysteine O-methyltransferase Ste14